MCRFWESGTCTKTAKDCLFLYRKSNWTKPVPASPASNDTFEKPRVDSPAPTKYTKAQKKEYNEAKKAEAEKTAKKEKRSASAAKRKAKKADKAAAVAVLVESNGLSPLDR